MSIPKEPRQIMINLMYLVLTAMLALNVSAEIFNAFKVVNAGLVDSNNSLNKTNEVLPSQIEKYAAKKAEFAKYKDRVAPAKSATDEFVAYVDGLMNQMIEQTGGMVPDEHATDKNVMRMKGYKDKDVTTRLLVNEKKGDELEKKILELRDKLANLFDPADKDKESGKLTLKVDETWKSSKDKKSWAQYNFSHMPLAAVQPILNKFKNDALASESTVLNYLMNKIGATDEVIFDKFQVVSAPKKSYVILGDKFETEIFLSSSSSNVKGMSVSVNGAGVPVVDGVAKYTSSASSPGVKPYTANITIVNPVTNQPTTYTNKFEYEVGQRSATVSADKMNVFYVGVDNPITVSAAGVSTNDLRVTAEGGSISNTGKGSYNVKVTNIGGTCNIVLSGKDFPSSKYPFRIKRIPDPTARVGGSLGGAIGNGTFKAQQGVEARLENFDFDARCVIQGFVIKYIARRQDPEQAVNSGSRFSGPAQGLVQKAKPGDIYVFDNVKARCPGDAAGRTINSLSFNIK